MRAMRACKTGPLLAYVEHIKLLSIKYPDYWGIISMADSVMRTERWPRMRAEMEESVADGARPPMFWHIKLPWTAILIASVKDRDYWWDSVHEPIQLRLKNMTPEQAAAAAHTGHLTDDQQVMSLYPPGYGPPAGRPTKTPALNDGAPTKKSAAQKAADRAARKASAGDKPPPTNKPKKQTSTRRPDGRLMARNGVPLCLSFQKGSCTEPCDDIHITV